MVRLELLKSLETDKKNIAVKDWMDETAKQIIQIITYIDGERQLLGNKFPHDIMLHDILANACEEILIHYQIDDRTGELRSALVGPV